MKLIYSKKAERFSNFGPIIQIGSDLLSANVASTWLNITKTDWDGDMAPVIWSRNEVDATWPWFACGSNYVINKKEWVHIAVTVSGSTTIVCLGLRPRRFLGAGSKSNSSCSS